MPETTDRAGAETLDALNLIVDNDFPAYCARLRLVLHAMGTNGAAVPREEKTTAYAGNALREWYREEMLAYALQAAEAGARRDHVRAQPLDGPRVAYVDSLPNAAVQVLHAVAMDALQNVTIAQWAREAEQVLSGHEWAPTASRIWETLQVTNPNEPAGEWSVFDCVERTNAYPGAPVTADDVQAALDGLVYHGIVTARYVGGTSRHLYSLAPAPRLPREV